MLSILLYDRLLWPTAIYATLAFGLLQAARFTHYLVAFAAVLLLTGFYLKSVIFHYEQERRLDRLGKRAPLNRSHTPFNVGMILKAVKSFSKNKNMEFWINTFRTMGNPKLPYTVETVTVGERLILTADEENIKAILATQFQDYGKGPQFRADWKDFLGLSIFTTDGALWHDSRSLLRPQFIKDRVSDLKTFEGHLKKLLPLLEGDHVGATVRFDDLIYRYTLDAITEFLMGRSVNSLDNGQSEFAHAFAEIQRIQATIARLGPLKDLMPRADFNRHLNTLNTFVGQYIDQALSLPAEALEQNAKSDESYTFLHAIAGYTRNRQVLRDQLVAVLLAGRDTTALSLSWLIYELSKQPQIVAKLREEIISIVGLDNEPTYDHLKNMRYLQHTLNEGLRLYPAVPFNVRVALQDTTLPHGGGPDGTEPIAITKDTPVGYSTLVMQRRADIYPETSADFPDPTTFVPDRWEKWTPKAWTYIPFNGGPRICIGQQFALTEMGYTIVRILQTFERIECRTTSPPELKSDIVLAPAQGVHVSFLRSEKAR